MITVEKNISKHEGEINIKKIISILTILLVLFVLSGAVSAANPDQINADNTTSIDDSPIINPDFINNNSQPDDNATVDDATIIDDNINSGTYSDLADEIGDGGNITLDKDIYIYDSGSTIRITTPCIIDGNGAIIDMMNSNVRIFDVLADCAILKNITFKNVNIGNNDGAVRFLKSGIVYACNFINITGHQGSAISMTKGAVLNSNFINNTAYAGTVFIDKGIVSNCNFINNTAFEGAALGMNYGIANNCNFENNHADRNAGALWLMTGVANNCTFDNNYAGNDGGAIWMHKGIVNNCSVENNFAYNNGGGVYINAKGAVANSNLTKNDGFFGGALYMKEGKVGNCNFDSNFAEAYGAGVYMKTGEVTNSNFNADTAVGQWKVIFIGDNYKVNNCNFTKINPDSAIGSNSDSNGTIEDCHFDS